MSVTGRDRTGAGWGLGFALLGGAVAWIAHLNAAYFAAEFLCLQGRWQGVEGDLVFYLSLGAVTVLAFLVAVLAAVAGGRLRRRVRRETPPLSLIAGLPVVAALLSLSFAVLIVIESLPFFVVGCGGPS